MKQFNKYLELIDREYSEALTLLEHWSNINSGTENTAGLKQMGEWLEKTFSPLGDSTQFFSLQPWKKMDAKGSIAPIPLGQALSIVKRPLAKKKILLAGHMDTVFPKNSPFQNCRKVNGDKLIGPGVCDMKGGLMILYLGLKAFENSPYAENIGWEVFINPDEEIGSVGSKALLEERAAKYDFALLFEPAYSDGALVGQRKGSATFTVLAKGKAAHVGRDFHMGKSAISALARFIVKAEQIHEMSPGITLNIGHILGGGPVNIVPDLASCRINVRFNTQEDRALVAKYLEELAYSESKDEGLDVEIHLEVERPPKPLDEKTHNLYLKLQDSALKLDQTLFLRPSGGVSDGNILAAAGLANLDTLGAIGGDIHTYDEYILTDSINQRAKLLALFLMMEAK